jgi:hypothetical protein
LKKIARVFVLLLLFNQCVNCFDTKTASKIYDKLFFSIYKKNTILVYTPNQTYKSMLQNSQILKNVETIEEATVIIISNQNEITPKMGNKTIFAANYEVFRDNENAIGAFYWNKGRPEIVFSQSRLLGKNLSVSQDLEKYIR